MKTNMIKRISLLLVACLLMAMIPTALADEPAGPAYTSVWEYNGTQYTDLSEAVEAVPLNNTEPAVITMITPGTGCGVKIWAPRNIVFDLNGGIYEVTTPTVGSTGTATNGFQLRQGNTITFKNGAITSDTAKILLQNYCDLTIDNVDLSLTTPIDTAKNDAPYYVASNNSGNVTITGDSDITANGSDYVALDVWFGASNDYAEAGVSVTFDAGFTGTVTGTIEYGASNPRGRDDWTEAASITMNGSGDFSGVKFVTTKNIENIANANVTANSGKFSASMPKAFIPEGAETATDAAGNIVIGRAATIMNIPLAYGEKDFVSIIDWKQVQDDVVVVPEAAETETYTVKAPAYLRVDTATTAKFVTLLKAGDEIAVYEVVDGWATAEIDGARGYVNAAYIEK